MVTIIMIKKITLTVTAVFNQTSWFHLGPEPMKHQTAYLNSPSLFIIIVLHANVFIPV